MNFTILKGFRFPLFILIALTPIFLSCVSVSGISEGAVRSFMEDDDPELVGDSLPTLMKSIEIAIESAPKNESLLKMGGMLFVMYANAFVQTPASMLSDDDYEERVRMMQRAKKLYRRGRDYLLRALDLKHKGFSDMLIAGEIDQALSLLNEKDLDTIYWCGAGWAGFLTADPFDFKAVSQAPQALGLLMKGYTLDKDFKNGAFHEIFMQIYGGMPAIIFVSYSKAPEIGKAMEALYKEDGISSDTKERLTYHFKRAVEISEGKSASPYIGYASAVSIPSQNYQEYNELLNKALAIDVDENKKNRLVLIINQRKARWMVENSENYFILEEDETVLEEEDIYAEDNE